MMMLEVMCSSTKYNVCSNYADF